VSRVAVLSAVVGCLATGWAGGWALLAGRTFETVLDWQGVPFCTLRLGLDPLSGFFTVVIALLGLLGAIYGVGYWAGQRGRWALGFGWAEYLLLVAAMLGVVAAHDGVAFLVAWEVMSLVSFLLVLFERERPETLEAGWIYLTAAHLGAACLLTMFLLLGREANSMDFAEMGKGLGTSTGAATAVFLLALVGFGSKAGFVPMHVWLPEAHPAAPSHVSALMSGVMIKMGIYGILRVLWMLGAPPAWWGWVVLGIGAVSGVLGVLLALAQHDLKRLLAYHSVENIGIIALGLGLGMLGWHAGNGALAAVGFAAALLHVLNHAVFKGLLFLAAGSVLHAAHTRDMDQLGGLMRRMPVTGTLFLLGSAAIAGLPPLNGFVSEFLIYLASFREVASETAPMAGRLAGILALVSLSLIGGLACACFVKAAGTVFLGEPRDAKLRNVHEAGSAMLAAMGVLGVLCVAIGLGGPLMLRGVWNAVLEFRFVESEFPFAATVDPQVLTDAMRPLVWVSACGGGLIVLALALALLRRAFLRGRVLGESGTWDCGYAAPTARMQYTSSSFASSLVGLFRSVLRTHTDLQEPDGLFPSRASLHSHTGDVFRSGIFRPVFRLVEILAVRLRPLQQGRVQMYVLYLAVTLLILLIWKLR
jgi:formate hydrogenlyase subunit 3/multisubunit Na+/H+ antiporter MnhD subunit